MNSITRRAAALLVGSTLAVQASAQTPLPTLPAATAPVPAPVVAAAPVVPEQRPVGVAAKINGQEIPEVAVYRALRQFPITEREVARKEILNHLVENFLIDQYLTALKISAESAEVEKLIAELKAELAKTMKDYAKELEAMMLTEAEFRSEVSAQMKWDKFLKQQGTDAALKQLFDASPNVFDGSTVRAKHILLTPGADAAKIEESKKLLESIKATIEADAKKVADATPGDPLVKEQARGKRIDETFSDFAKKHSTCPSKANGGDLNFFPRVGAMVEPFAKAAFDLNPNGMSEVVSTEFGMHLILCSAKKPGVARKFDDVKEDVRALYAIRLREAVVAQMKPKAQIDIVRPVATAAISK